MYPKEPSADGKGKKTPGKHDDDQSSQYNKESLSAGKGTEGRAGVFQIGKLQDPIQEDKRRLSFQMQNGKAFCVLICQNQQTDTDQRKYIMFQGFHISNRGFLSIKISLKYGGSPLTYLVIYYCLPQKDLPQKNMPQSVRGS